MISQKRFFTKDLSSSSVNSQTNSSELARKIISKRFFQFGQASIACEISRLTRCQVPKAFQHTCRDPKSSTLVSRSSSVVRSCTRLILIDCDQHIRVCFVCSCTALGNIVIFRDAFFPCYRVCNHNDSLKLKSFCLYKFKLHIKRFLTTQNVIKGS